MNLQIHIGINDLKYTNMGINQTCEPSDEVYREDLSHKSPLHKFVLQER